MARMTKAELEKELEDCRQTYGHDTDAMARRNDLLADTVSWQKSEIERLTRERDVAQLKCDDLAIKNERLAAWQDGARFFGLSVGAGIRAGVTELDESLG